MSKETDSPKNIHEIRINNLVSNILYANPQNRELMENFQSSEVLTNGIKDLVRASAIIGYYARGNGEYQIEQTEVMGLTTLGAGQIWGANSNFSSIVEKQYPINEILPEDPKEIFSRNIALLTSLGLDLSLISKTDNN